jgi:hypothetical protein
MSSVELRRLIPETPLRDDYQMKYEEYLSQIHSHAEASRLKDRLFKEYKEALAHFKRVSVNPKGTRAQMTPEIRVVREEKERRYKLYREVLNGVFVETQTLVQLSKNIYMEAVRKYQTSMECFIVATLQVRELGDRNQVIFQTELQRRNNELTRRLEEKRLVKETIVQMTRAELDETMDDVCIICMDPHSIGDTVLTCCGHRFGQDCFNAWAKHRNESDCDTQCAMCKKDNPSITKYQEREMPVVIDLTLS